MLFNVHTMYVPALGMESLSLLIMFAPGVGLSGCVADAPCVRQGKAEQCPYRLLSLTSF